MECKAEVLITCHLFKEQKTCILPVLPAGSHRYCILCLLSDINLHQLNSDCVLADICMSLVGKTSPRPNVFVICLGRA